jgi:signal transduction histidine kinase
MSLSAELFGDLLGDDLLVVPRPAPSPPASPDEFAEVLASSHLVHASARDQMALLAHAVDVTPWCAVVACDSGVIVHARGDGAIEADRAPGARLFGDAEQAALRARRAIRFDHPGHADCDIVVPFFQGALFSGALALRLAGADLTRPLVALLVQTARTIGALVHAQVQRVQHEQAVATIGHEIRQPLSALVTALDLVQRLSPSPPGAAFRTAQRQALQLVRLIDALLDASRVLGGGLRLNRRLIDLRAVLTAATDDVRADIAAKHQHLAWSVPERPVWCMGDPERLQEVAINLLTNAHRYTPEGGAIQLTVDQAGDAAVMFSVRDTGIGMDLDARERLFRPFDRLSASPEGLGIGLAISLEIVRGHGGVLAAESNEPEPGTRFRVELPGLLGRTREICAAVQRTRDETRSLVQRARAARQARPGRAF